MEIELKRGYGYTLIVTAENVKIEEDIESRVYHKTPDGKTDFSKNPERDVSDGSIEMISKVLSDMIYYRDKDFNSSDLIKQLFERLPFEISSSLSDELKKEYFINEE